MSVGGFNTDAMRWAWARELDNPNYKFVLVCMSAHCLPENQDSAVSAGCISLLCDLDVDIVIQCIDWLSNNGFITRVVGAAAESPLAVVWRVNSHQTDEQRIDRLSQSVRRASNRGIY